MTTDQSANEDAVSKKESMTEVMETPGALTPNGFDEFLQTGRTGRRNALGEILSEDAKVNTADLPVELEKLSCSDNPNVGEGSGSSSGGTSGASDAPAEP